MTTRSPQSVQYEYLAYAHGTGFSEDLNVTNITPAADIDGRVYTAATVTVAPVSDMLWSFLDPRSAGNPRVTWQITQVTYDSGVRVVLGTIPNGVAPNTLATMWIREAERDLLSGEVTLTLQGGESRQSDKIRNSDFAIDTGAANVSTFVQWSLTDVFGSYVFSDDAGAASVSIPAGDRRLMLPGDTHADLLQPELDAMDARVADLWGRKWVISPRSAPTTGRLQLATFAAAPSDYDPIVTLFKEKKSRDGEWADGVLLRYQPPGTTAITYRRSGTGANTRGAVVDVKRAAPAANAANQMAVRSQKRGHDITITARIRCDLALASVDNIREQLVMVALQSGSTITARIRSVTWDTSEGLMYISAQSEPVG